MTHVVERDVVDVLRDVAGNVNVQLRTDYSGRAMYGDACLGIVTDDVSGLVRFVIALTSATNSVPDDVAERVSALVDELEYVPTRVDCMGTGVVYYWPGIEVTT